MLVLTRRLNQSIKIGDDIEIMVIEVRGDQVRLGITAPREVSVHRKEVYLQIQQENLNAAHQSASPDSVAAAFNGLFGATSPEASSDIIRSAAAEPRPLAKPTAAATPTGR